MQKFGIIEDTLFIPMLGRIYASERYPHILYDEAALALKQKLPKDVLESGRHSQYTLLASAARAANMDRYIKDFLTRRPDGIIAQLGCGLETAHFRNENETTRWYAIDLPNVIAYRRSLLPQAQREHCIAGNAFTGEWIKRIRADAPKAPLLVTAGGLFYYFQEERILALLRMLQKTGNVELVFDAVNRRGMTMLRRKYLKQMGHAQAQMYFYVDCAAALTAKLDESACVLADEPYYRRIPKTGLQLSTQCAMAISDKFGMLRMIQLRL